MKKFLFFLFAAISIFTLSSCGSIGVELIEPYSYYPNGYYNPYGTVIYYDTPVFTRYSKNGRSTRYAFLMVLKR